MGEFLVKGDYKKSGLDFLICGRMDNLAVGSCRYSSLLNESGGVIDDLIVYRKAPEEWMIVVNAATIEKDKKHFLSHLTKDAQFFDLSERFGKIDLQGPLARDIIRTIAPAACGLKYYTFIETNILGEKNIVSRTGYTGELGFEIYASLDKIVSVWQKLLRDERVKPAGLGARDVLRLEMGYSLYGQDIDEEITPLEAGLEKFIDFSKSFLGKKTLLKKNLSEFQRTRIFLKSLSRRSPRHNHRIYADNKECGFITSGTFSPHTESGIGMGFVDGRNLSLGAKIDVGTADLKIEAVITDKPFVKSTSLKD